MFGSVFRRLSVVFAGGVLGGLTNSLTVWWFGRVGVTGWVGVQVAPALSPGWLYPRLVWGGLWGFLFLLPGAGGRPWLRGFVLSLGPTLVQCFVVFPYRAGAGAFGLELGTLTPLFVVLFNAVWGWTAAAWIEATKTPSSLS